MVTKATDVSVTSSDGSGKKKKKKKKKEKKDENRTEAEPGKAKSLASQLIKKFDRTVNSPSMATDLIEKSQKRSPDDAGDEVTNPLGEFTNAAQRSFDFSRLQRNFGFLNPINYSLACSSHS